MRKRKFARSFSTALVALFFHGGIAAAELANLPDDPFELIVASGAVGYVLCALSVVALALCIDAFLHTRHKRLLPEAVLEQLEAHVDDNDFDAALECCRENDCLLTRIVAAGLNKTSLGYERMTSAAQEETDAQEALLYQKLGNLNLIAIIAPMLGLLGTVAGMITAFGVMARQGGGADASTLASGIYVALITTLEGIVVSIPTAAAFSILRARIAKIMTALAIINSEILDRFRAANDSK